MEKMFHGPGGPVKYEVLWKDPDSRIVVSGGGVLGELVATPSTDPRWCILGLGSSSPLFCSQYSAAEYLLLWKMAERFWTVRSIDLGVPCEECGGTDGWMCECRFEGVV